MPRRAGRVRATHPRVGNGHDSLVYGKIECLRHLHHDGSLDGPLATAGGNEQVHQTRTQESEDRVGDIVRDGDEPAGNDGDQTRKLHHPHDTGIERKLDDDSGTGLRPLADRPDVIDRSALQEDAHEEKSEVNDVQVKGLNPLVPK